DTVVAEGDSAGHILSDALRWKRCFGKQAAEGLGGEDDVVGAVGRDALDQRPGELVTLGAAKLHRLGMGAEKGGMTVACAGVVGGPWGGVAEDLAELGEERRALLPAIVGKDDAGGVAVEAGIVGQHAGQVRGVVGKV